MGQVQKRSSQLLFWFVYEKMVLAEQVFYVVMECNGHVSAHCAQGEIIKSNINSGAQIGISKHADLR